MKVRDFINSSKFQDWIEFNFPPYKRGRSGPDIWEPNPDIKYVGAIIEELGPETDIDDIDINNPKFIEDIRLTILRRVF